MVSEKVTIRNENGIHLRPAGMLVGEANKFRCHVMMYYGERKMNCKSLMSLLAFPVCPGEEVIIECEGEDDYDFPTLILLEVYMTLFKYEGGVLT